MIKDFKIYYGDTFVSVMGKQQQKKEKNISVITDEEAAMDFFGKQDELFQTVNNNPGLVYVVKDPYSLMKALKERADLIIAGGGLVTNHLNELLMIYRNGKWDLPKGKIEKGEKISEGAIREVEEETGVKVMLKQQPEVVTYHTYFMKGKNCIKETHWFHMQAAQPVIELIPQREEGIDKVVWVSKSEFENYRIGSYLLVWDLIKTAVI